MKKIRIFGVMFLIFTLALTGCATDSDSPEIEESKDTLIIGSGFDIDSMDPQNTGSLISMKIITNIYDTLFKTDPSGNVSNQLVEDWEESEDKMSYTIKLKEGVMFHNGEELKASDAVFSLRRGMESPFAGAIFMSVAEAEVIDEYSFVVQLKYPYAPFLYAMATPLASIVNEKAVTEAGEDYSRKPVGTAAYQLVSWDSGDRVVLEGFEDWHMGDVPIKNIIFRVIEDLSTAVISLEQGEIDLLLDVATTERQRIIDHENLQLYDVPSHLYGYLGFNVEAGYFTDAKVREAVAYAIDREGITEVATDGVGTVATNYLTETIFGFTPDVVWYDQDIEKAKSLMLESNYPDGFKCKAIARDLAGQRTAQVVKENLALIGIDMEIEVLERSAHLDRTRVGDFDIAITTWSSPVPDADYSLNFLYHSSMIGAMNVTRYNSPRMDELILNGQMELDPELRKDIYKEIMEILKNDIPAIPIYYSTSSLAANKNLKNVVPSPSSTYYFYELSW